MMRTTFEKLGPLALTGLAMLVACPSDDGPMGGTTNGTNTDSGTDTDPPPTSADSTESSGDGDCGNDMIDGQEQCDGSDLGGSTCADVNPAFEGGTLTCGDSCTFDASACELPPGTALIALNEVTSETVLEGDFAGLNDAIELHNAGNTAADLSGWKLSDDPAFPVDKTYVFPNGTMLEPGEFLVLLAFDDVTMTGELPFGVSDNSEETLALADAAGGVVDSVVVDGYLARESYCRVPDASGPWFQCEQTFGAENQAADTACGNNVTEDLEQCDGKDLTGTCEELGIGFTGGTLACSPTCKFETAECTIMSDLVLNELSATTDGIEIFNGGNTMFDLSGLVLTDDRIDASYDVTLDLEALVFSPGTTLGPGEYLVVPPGLESDQHPFGLSAMGDRVTLAELSPVTVIDHVTYEDGEATTSYCRLPNGPGGIWVAGCPPTMGAEN
jgi:Lamin Tail Domain